MMWQRFKSLLYMTLPILALAVESNRQEVQLEPAYTNPNLVKVTGLGFYTTFVRSARECVLSCMLDRSCIISGFEGVSRMCLLYQHELQPRPLDSAQSAFIFHVFPTHDLAYSCDEVLARGSMTSGVYPILAGGVKLAFVYCDQVTTGGGWTVFQRRIDGSVDFQRPWADYRAGFGSPDAEHWLGNELLHLLTRGQHLALRVELVKVEDGSTLVAEYGVFNISDEESDYRLLVGQYDNVKSTVDDALIDSHSGRAFSTWDRDNDEVPSINCASRFKGSWWFSACHTCDLNGVYGSTEFGQGINWIAYDYSYQATRMMLRAK